METRHHFHADLSFDPTLAHPKLPNRIAQEARRLIQLSELEALAVEQVHCQPDGTLTVVFAGARTLVVEGSCGDPSVLEPWVLCEVGRPVTQGAGQVIALGGSGLAVWERLEGDESGDGVGTLGCCPPSLCSGPDPAGAGSDP